MPYKDRIALSECAAVPLKETGDDAKFRATMTFAEHTSELAVEHSPISVLALIDVVNLLEEDGTTLLVDALVILIRISFIQNCG